MKIKCIANTGEFLRAYEDKSLRKDVLGRFGATGYTELWIGKEYLVMGIIIFETYLAFLLDDGGLITACPCQLFEVVDGKINSNWHFRSIEKDEDIYPFIQAIFGYPESCSDKKAYENLIVEMEEETQRIYFRRKAELEKELAENEEL